MNRQGFTLIEVLIAIAISAFMTTILFTALYQINSSVNVTASLMTVNEKAARLQQLFERDLSGATTLLDNELPKAKDKELTPTSTGDKQDRDKKEEKPTEKKEKHIIKKIFNSINKGNQLGTLTFISNNPLLGFWATKAGSHEVGKPKPFLVRITYQLEEDPKAPGSYILMRQESVPLDYEKRSGRSYEVLDGIKSLSFKYTAKTVKTDEAKEEQAESPKPGVQGTEKEPQKKPETKARKKTEVTYTSNLTTWNSDEKTDEVAKKEEPKEKRLPIPVFVDIEVVLWDDVQQREFKYIYTQEIITDTEFIQKKREWSFVSFFQKQQEKEKAEQTKTQQSTQPGMQKPSIPGTTKTTGLNTPYRPSSNLQKQLDELFKAAHSLDARMNT